MSALFHWDVAANTSFLSLIGILPEHVHCGLVPGYRKILKVLPVPAGVTGPLLGGVLKCVERIWQSFSFWTEHKKTYDCLTQYTKGHRRTLCLFAFFSSVRVLSLDPSTAGAVETVGSSPARADDAVVLIPQPHGDPEKSVRAVLIICVRGPVTLAANCNEELVLHPGSARLLENCGSLQILAGNPSGAKLLVAYTVDTHIVAPASREERRKWGRDMKTLIDARSVYFVNTAHGSVAGAADGEAEKRELSVRADQESAGSSSGKNASDLQNSRADKVSELLKNVLAFDSIFP
jgi:hypothetical protein